MMANAYPLQWPDGWPRTSVPKRSNFYERPSGQSWGTRPISMSKGRDTLLEELRRLGARNIVLSTNIALRNDGLPRANQRRPDDTGVAVYFTLAGTQRCFPCDQWDRVEDNLYAIAKTIDALRGIDRWGSKQMVEATFSGFASLPAPNEEQPWRTVLGFRPDYTPSRHELKSTFRRLAFENHPDHGGDPDIFNRIHKAFEQASEEIGE